MSLFLIGIMVFATVITRFLPFALFPAGKETPEFVAFLGETLPYATIGLLVVYCLKGMNVTAFPYGLPEILAVCLVVLLHSTKGNSLLSIGAGTAAYMILLHLF